MRKSIKEALLRVTEIVVHAETDCSQEVHARDKAYEKFHPWASPRLLDYTTPLKRGGRTKKKPRRRGAPLPLLVPCFFARTRPLLWRTTSERFRSMPRRMKV